MNSVVIKVNGRAHTTADKQAAPQLLVEVSCLSNNTEETKWAFFLCTQSCSGRGLVTEGCWGKQTTSLLVSSGQGEGERKRGASGHRGYLAASPQVGGYVAVDYGYDAEVYPQTHLGELGGQKGHLLPTRLAPVCKAGVSNSALESFPANKALKRTTES